MSLKRVDDFLGVVTRIDADGASCLRAAEHARLLLKSGDGELFNNQLEPLYAGIQNTEDKGVASYLLYAVCCLPVFIQTINIKLHSASRRLAINFSNVAW